MRATEFLRGLADMLSAIENDKLSQGSAIAAVDSSSAVLPVTSEKKPEIDNPKMIPPLQQKLEIMKKMAGLPNQVDNATVIVADEDEPFEG